MFSQTHRALRRGIPCEKKKAAQESTTHIWLCRSVNGVSWYQSYAQRFSFYFMRYAYTQNFGAYNTSEVVRVDTIWAVWSGEINVVTAASPIAMAALSRLCWTFYTAWQDGLVQIRAPSERIRFLLPSIVLLAGNVNKGEKQSTQVLDEQNSSCIPSLNACARPDIYFLTPRRGCPHKQVLKPVPKRPGLWLLYAIKMKSMHTAQWDVICTLQCCICLLLAASQTCPSLW